MKSWRAHRSVGGLLTYMANVAWSSALTGRATERFDSPTMRQFLLVASFACVIGLNAEAAPKKAAPAKAAPAAAKKAPGKSAPNVNLNTEGAIPGSVPDAAPQASGAAPQRGPTRIDFDDRLIQGQSNKSGAVYLYDRKELKIRSMIKKRESFRDEIVGSLYDT
jgi:hypothetical protein